MTFAQAVAWAQANPLCEGFTYESAARRPEEPVRVWFKTRLCILCAPNWWSYSLGRHMS